MNNNMAKIREDGLRALNNELGPTGTILFIRQFESGNGDYTEERADLLEGLSIDDIVESIRNRKDS